jgi:hypothetical protein
MSLNLADEVFLSYSAGIFNVVKSYDTGPTALLPPKEVVLRIFIDLKNPTSSGLNPRTLGPIEITITTTPPRTTTTLVENARNLSSTPRIRLDDAVLRKWKTRLHCSCVIYSHCLEVISISNYERYCVHTTDSSTTLLCHVQEATVYDLQQCTSRERVCKET